MKRQRYRSLTFKKVKGVGRAASVAAAVLVVAGGVTFAALQSQQIKLTGNTIQTATANLLISTDGTNYAAAQPGFTFNDLIPGGRAMPQSGYNIYLRNGGSTPLALKLAITNAPSNPDNVDLSKVMIIFTPVNGGLPESFSLQDLVTAGNGGLALSAPATLFAGNRAQFTMQASMATDAVSGSSASLGNIDFTFTGVAQSS
jgi:hypothetical protein